MTEEKGLQRQISGGTCRQAAGKWRISAPLLEQ